MKAENRRFHSGFPLPVGENVGPIPLPGPLRQLRGQPVAGRPIFPQDFFFPVSGRPIEALADGIGAYHALRHARRSDSFQCLLHCSVPPNIRIILHNLERGTVHERRIALRYGDCVSRRLRENGPAARHILSWLDPTSFDRTCTGTASRVHSFHLACLEMIYFIVQWTLFSIKGYKTSCAADAPRYQAKVSGTWHFCCALLAKGHRFGSPKNDGLKKRAEGQLWAHAPAAITFPSFLR